MPGRASDPSSLSSVNEEDGDDGRLAFPAAPATFTPLLPTPGPLPPPPTCPPTAPPPLKSLVAALCPSRLLALTSFMTMLSVLNSTSISNLRFSFSPGMSKISFSSAVQATSQGLGTRNTLLSAHDSSTLAQKGMTAMSLPVSNASRMSCLRSRCLARMGLFLAMVRRPSQEPRFLSRERSEEEERTLSEERRTLMLSYVVSNHLLAQLLQVDGVEELRVQPLEVGLDRHALDHQVAREVSVVGRLQDGLQLPAPCCAGWWTTRC